MWSNLRPKRERAEQEWVGEAGYWGGEKKKKRINIPTAKSKETKIKGSERDGKGEKILLPSNS